MQDFCSFRAQGLTLDLHSAGTAHPFGIDPPTFVHNVVLICGKIRERLNQSVRPADHDLLCLEGFPKAEVNAQIALGNKTVATANFLLICIAALFERHPCPQSGAIRFQTDQLKADEVAYRRGVAIQRGSFVHIVHESFFAPVVEQVAQSHATTGVQFGERASGMRCDIGERSVVQIVVDHFGLAVTGSQILAVYLGVNMTIGDQDAGPPAIVDIIELDSPSQPARNPSQASILCDIVKYVLAPVQKQCRRIVAEIGLDDILIAFMRIIIRRDAHAGLHGALFVEGNTGHFAEFGESSVLIVVIEKIWRCVTSDIDIRPSVTVEISRQRGETITTGSPRDSGGSRDISECAVAVVVIKRVDAHFEAPRSAHNVYTFPRAPRSLARPRDGVIAEVHITRYEEIGAAVAVIVEKATPSAPLRFGGLQPGLFRYVRKSAVPVVVVEDVLPPIC